MTASERIRLLRRHGLENAVIAAILGVETADVAAHVADPSVDVALGGGGSVDVTGLLPLDGSRAMTGPLEWAEGPSLRQLGSALALGGDGGSELYLVPNESGAVSWGGSYLDTWVGDTYANLELHTATGNITMYAADERVQFGADVSLERDTSGVFNNTGIGDLRIPGHHALIVGLDGDYSLAGAYYGPDDLFMQSEGSASLAEMQPGYLSLSGSGAGASLSARTNAVLTLGGGIPAIHLGDVALTQTAPGTLEIDHTLSFKGADSDATSGVTLGWDEGLYGLVLKGRPGSFDGELYTVNGDDVTNYGNLYPGGVTVHNGADEGGYAYMSPQQLHLHGDGGDEVILDTNSDYAVQITRHGGGIHLISEDGSQSKGLRLSNAGELELVDLA